MIKRLLLAMSLLSAGPAAAAGWCDDLWFTRNLVMDRAGYCFGSALGRTYFDNGDCVGTSVSPQGAAARLMRQVQRLEAESGCKGRVDTNGTWLDVPDMGVRSQLDNLPLIAETPSACIGWRGPLTALQAGRRVAPHAFGLIEPNDTVSFDHAPEDGWVYVTAYFNTAQEGSPWRLKSGGWIQVAQVNATPCDSYLP